MPDATVEGISRFPPAVKMRASQRVKADLLESGSRSLSRLTVRQRPGRTVFRYWQEGPGYDATIAICKPSVR